MKRKYHVISTLIVITILCAFVLIGCVGQQNATPQRQQPGTVGPGGQQLGTPGINGQNTDRGNRGDLLDNNPDMSPDMNMDMNGQTQQLGQVPQPGQTNASSNKQKAENISNQLKKMNEVDEVNTVCSGNTAVVAYDPSNTGGDTEKVKNEIINRVKDLEPTITNVVVSESADIMQKVKTLANNMANRPMNEIDDEIRKLIQQIQPTMR
ncbi:MAG: YhcN/YlaJ family sporulation lipoprotein [Acetivibrionales bacterium]